MKKVFLVLLFAASILAISASEVSACLCDMKPVRVKIRELRRSCDAIFIGTVVDAVKERDEEGFFVLKMVFVAQQIWKGDGEEFVVYSKSGCGAWFFTGERALVYAKKDTEGKLQTTVCMRTRAVENSKEDLKYLGKPRTVIGGGQGAGSPSASNRLRARTTKSTPPAIEPAQCSPRAVLQRSNKDRLMATRLFDYAVIPNRLSTNFTCPTASSPLSLFARPPHYAH